MSTSDPVTEALRYHQERANRPTPFDGGRPRVQSPIADDGDAVDRVIAEANAERANRRSPLESRAWKATHE